MKTVYHGYYDCEASEIRASRDSSGMTFREAKKDLIESLEADIAVLRQTVKRIRSTKKKDVFIRPSGGEYGMGDCS